MTGPSATEHRDDPPGLVIPPAWLAIAIDTVTDTVTDPDLGDYLCGITTAARQTQRESIAVADLEAVVVELSGPPWPTAAPVAAGGER